LIEQGKYPITDTMSKNLKSILNKILTCDATKKDLLLKHYYLTHGFNEKYFS
jgi:hypothetical protein